MSQTLESEIKRLLVNAIRIAVSTKIERYPNLHHDPGETKFYYKVVADEPRLFAECKVTIKRDLEDKKGLRMATKAIKLYFESKGDEDVTIKFEDAPYYFIDQYNECLLKLTPVESPDELEPAESSTSLNKIN